MNRRPIQNQRVAYRVIDGSAVLVSPKDSSLYSLNGTATLIWTLCDGRHDVEAIVDRLRGEFDVDRETAERDATAMLDEFTGRRLLEWADAGASDAG